MGVFHDNDDEFYDDDDDDDEEAGKFAVWGNFSQLGNQQIAPWLTPPRWSWHGHDDDEER